MPGGSGLSYARVFADVAEITMHCCRYAQSLLAAAVLAVPIDAGPGPEAWLVALPDVPEAPLLALLAAGLALGLARGGSVRRPVRRRPD